MSRQHKIPLPSGPSVQCQTECNPKTVPEIFDIINELINGRAVGEKQHPSEVYKSYLSSINRRLRTPFVLIREDEKSPSDWGISILLPIPKKRDNPVCKNYWDINSTDVSAKTFDGLLINHIPEARGPCTRPNHAGSYRAEAACIQPS